MQYVIKVIVTTAVIMLTAELAKRHTIMASILISMPIMSIMAFIWLYVDTKDVEKISDLSIGIAWAVAPSILFIITLPLLLRAGVKFVPAMVLSATVMATAYMLYAYILNKFGIKL